jgi:hemerythrin-like metal-binding protein
MSVLEWSEELSVGIHRFDEHHKALIGYINQLHDAMQVGKGKDALGKILAALIEYTASHFKAEEALMVKCNYPGYMAHKKEHASLTATVLELQGKFNSGQAALSVETIQFLKEWLTHHIMGTDKQYSPYLKKAGED